MNSSSANRKYNANRRTSIPQPLRRLLEFLLMMLALSLLVFLMARLCPGDPLRAWYGDGIDRMNEAQKQAARTSLGLDQPLIVQYGVWLRNLLRGNPGISFQYKQPVMRVIGNVWGNTLIFGLASYALTFALAFPLGRWCAAREDSRADRLLRRVGVVTGNIPSFFLAMIFILIFAVKLGILPSGGAYSYGNSADPIDRIAHLVLPVAVVVTGHLGYYSYLVRNLLLEETRKDYVLLLKAEGLPGGRILRKYCMRNILPPMFSIMATAVPHLIGGAYIVEMVFGYPGLGTLSFESALYKDYNMLMAVTLLTGAVVLLCNILAEVFAARIDPRMRSDGGGGAGETGWMNRPER